MALERPFVRAPDFPSVPWLNTPDPLTMGGLRGRVVLVHIWDFTCINCLRTLPYIRAWEERYQDAGLTAVGIHTPEFAFARNRRLVASAVGRLGIRWPVLLDNEQSAWTAWANRYWPTIYLVDSMGYVRYRKAGEGDYARTEEAIHGLLREMEPDRALPSILDPLRAEDVPGAVCLRSTPELQVDSLGNRPADRTPPSFELPPSLEEGHFYLQGVWHTSAESVTFLESPGEIVLPFHAASVHAVLSPGPDPEALPLDPVRLRIEVDGRPLPGAYHGGDAFLEGGLASLRVDEPRLYHLAAGLDSESHVLRLRVDQPGLTFYAFTFGACLAPVVPLPSSLAEAKPC